MSKYHCFQQRVTGQAVGPMQSCTGTFTGCIQMLNRCTPPLIGFNTTATVMCCRCHRYHMLCYINTKAFTLLINIREVMNKFFQIHMTAIEPHMFGTVDLHFTVNCPCNNITWCKIFTFIVPFHKCFTLMVTQNTTISTYCFCYKKCLSFLSCLV